MSTSNPNTKPVIITGPIALLPPPAGYTEGTRFVTSDPGPTQEFALVVVAGVPMWSILASGGGSVAVPVNEIPFGTGAGITSSSALTFDPSVANFLTLRDTGGNPVIEAGGLVGVGHFLTMRDEAGLPLLDCNTGPAKRQIVIGDEAGHNLILFNTLTADLSVRFGEPGGPHLLVDMTNHIVRAVSANGVVWEVNWENGTPLTFPDLNTASLSNGGFHGEGQQVFIQSVLKLGEAKPGTGANCYWSNNGPGGTGWYTGDNKFATE